MYEIVTPQGGLVRVTGYDFVTADAAINAGWAQVVTFPRRIAP